MGLSLTYLSLVVLFNSFFISNYLLIRALRRYIDTTAALRQHDNNDSNSRNSKGEKNSKDKESNETSGGGTTVPTQSDGDGNNSNGEKISKEKESKETCGDKALEWIYAFLFQHIPKPEYEELRFPGWFPIPYKIGAITTSCLIVFFGIFFSEPVLNKSLGLKSENTSPIGGICIDTDLQSKVDGMVDRFVDRSNLPEAVAQMQTVTTFLEALQNDTALWGEEDYECVNDPNIKTKTDFRNWDGYGNEGGFHFFPGMCAPAQHVALEVVESQTCSQERCANGKIVDLNSISVAGVDELNSRIRNALEHSENLDTACEGCTTDNVIAMGFKALCPWCEHDHANDLDYTFGYTNEDFCETYTVPCPSFSRYNLLTKVVNDVELTKLEKFRNDIFDTSKSHAQEEKDFKDEKSEVFEEYYDLLKLLLKHMQIASYIYTMYTCLPLFFPIPQSLFNGDVMHPIRQFLFGFRRYTFFLLVIALWGLIWYIRFYTGASQLSTYMKVLFTDACAFRLEYPQSIGGNYSAVCNSLLQTHSEWSNANKAIHDILKMIEPMTECCGDYPYEYLKKFNSASDMELMSEYGFDYVTSSGNAFCSNCYLPINDPTFLGNMEVCEDIIYVNREILNLDEVFSISWFDVWIKSGLVGSMLLLPAAANFGTALTFLADPLMTCDGKYENPPKGFHYEISELKAIRNRIIFSLKLSASSRMIFWGILVNVIMINVVLGKERLDEEANSDAMTAVVILALATGIFVIAVLADRLLSKFLSTKITLIRKRHAEQRKEESEHRGILDRDIGQGNQREPFEEEIENEGIAYEGIALVLDQAESGEGNLDFYFEHNQHGPSKEDTALVLDMVEFEKEDILDIPLEGEHCQSEPFEGNVDNENNVVEPDQAESREGDQVPGHSQSELCGENIESEDNAMEPDQAESREGDQAPEHSQSEPCEENVENEDTVLELDQAESGEREIEKQNDDMENQHFKPCEENVETEDTVLELDQAESGEREIEKENKDMENQHFKPCEENAETEDIVFELDQAEKVELERGPSFEDFENNEILFDKMLINTDRAESGEGEPDNQSKVAEAGDRDIPIKFD